MFYVYIQIVYSSVKNYSLFVGISTVTNDFNDSELLSAVSQPSSIGIAMMHSREKFLTLSSKTTYYMVAGQSSGGAASSLTYYGTEVPTIIRAVCAYL